MTYWLVKSEPETWSWAEQLAKGEAGEPWSGVRNHQAKLNIAAMKPGDRALFYHSGAERAVVGVVEVMTEAEHDPTAEPGSPWVSVDIKAVASMKTPVTLGDVKAEPKLAEMVLVKNSRLSVQPVRPEEWRIVCRMGGVKA